MVTAGMLHACVTWVRCVPAHPQGMQELAEFAMRVSTAMGEVEEVLKL